VLCNHGSPTTVFRGIWPVSIYSVYRVIFWPPSHVGYKIRITKDNLEGSVRTLNRLTKSPETQYTRNKQGKLSANIGNYHLDWAYGGVRLNRMVSVGGGIKVISPFGFGTKRELYVFINGCIEAICNLEES